MKGKRIIGIDYGKNIGVALYDGEIVKPVGVFNKKDLFLSMKKWIFDSIVIGIPYNLKGSFSEKTFEVMKFAIAVKKKFKNKIVFLYDERFTTVYGKKVSNMNEKRYRKFKDLISAVEILDDFLKSPQLASDISNDKFIKVEDETLLERMKGRRIAVDKALLDPYDENLAYFDPIFLTNDPYHFYLLKKQNKYKAFFRKDIEYLNMNNIEYDLILKYEDGNLTLCKLCP